VLRMHVVTTYDAAANAFSVKVSYPLDPCRQRAAEKLSEVNLSETFPPARYIPGTRVYQELSGEPTEQ